MIVNKNKNNCQYAQNKNHWENIKIIRYADIILIASEAAFQTGNTTKATTYLNMIRSRAGLPNITATLAAIKNERRFEFAMGTNRQSGIADRRTAIRRNRRGNQR